jgi:hypothetical protein
MFVLGRASAAKSNLVHKRRPAVLSRPGLRRGQTSMIRTYDGEGCLGQVHVCAAITGHPSLSAEQNSLHAYSITGSPGWMLDVGRMVVHSSLVAWDMEVVLCLYNKCGLSANVAFTAAFYRPQTAFAVS